ncbi:nucleoside phosphorylase [Alicyclobacillus sp. ALC3]|uniref:nucleoside phosphorylase n=1 Tax=Alicyclobacillus sp. ALC3 TaxID=2796143 RepID=UPI002379EEBA|nr:nucleoside phosphorylase [Alicyclobacillus sp. ALC3]WDL97520.1 nucleoside phosphorylase [Alicyclobacillus sp. ALC3]
MTVPSATEAMRFTPQMYMDYHVRLTGVPIEEMGVAPTVIITWFRSVFSLITSAIDGKPLTSAPFPNARSGVFGETRTPVTVIQCPIGAPGTIAVMEELIACGARRFIGVGAAGSLQPDNRVGTILIPDVCVRDEGTSRHYVPSDATVAAHPSLRNRVAQSAVGLGLSAVVGPHWTTDAIYRESVADITQHREAGVLGVDMETSAMYAVGEFRDVEVANVLAVSDELWHEWNPAFGTEILNAALQRASEIALKAAED